MSRKSVQINLPVPGAAPAVPARTPARKTAGIDSWVAHAGNSIEEALAPPAGRENGLTVSVRLSTEPDWSEAAKIFFFLPQAAMWYWSLGMARRFTRGPYGWRL